MDSVALFSWIAWLCTNGFSGSIFMDWVAPPPWNIQRSTKFKNDLEVIFFEVFLLKMFVACMWPTHTILSQLGKRKKPLYKGFCVLLASKILTFRELNVSLFKAHSVIFASYARA